MVATLGGFSSDDPADFPQWYRQGRAVEKWWSPETNTADAERTHPRSELCVQIGYAARFDEEDLAVVQKRYFHDDDEMVDPFMDDAVNDLPFSVLTEIGFFVLPARRTWAATISFGSELFRKAVATAGGLPAGSLLKQRDQLRSPSAPLEDDPAIRPLVNRIDVQMAQLVPGEPKLQLRVTATDSESLLNGLVPHYARQGATALPAVRQGMGMVSLQTLVLLLEIGRARKENGQSFILAVEEPELHVPPGLQRRLIGEAAGVSDQMICTTHSPKVAAFFEPKKIQILVKVAGEPGNGDPGTEYLEGRPLASSSLVDEPNSVNKLYTDDRSRLVEALMFPCVLVPEGRFDYGWFQFFLDIVETGDHGSVSDSEHGSDNKQNSLPPFGAVVGVVPTRDAAVRVTFERLSRLHEDVFALVDGDPEGDGYVKQFLSCEPAPSVILQWPEDWTIEDVVGWAIGGDTDVLSDIEERLGRKFERVPNLVAALKNPDGRDGGLKFHNVAHEEIAAAMKSCPLIVRRAERLLGALVAAALGKTDGASDLVVDPSRSTQKTSVCRVLG